MNESTNDETRTAVGGRPEGACSARTGTAANHCWHGTGVILTSYPAQTEEVCCHCGEKRYTRQAIPDLAGHGQFAPFVTRLDAVATTGCKVGFETLHRL